MNRLKNAVRQLLREPLLHFALIGAILFAINAAREPSRLESDVIELMSGDVENLRSVFAKTWRRPPTTEELKGLIANRVREEVLHREAMALGLDNEDVIIRRRLVQKIEFLTDDLAARRDPSDEELQSFLDKNAQDYAIEARLSFRQIFLGNERKGTFPDNVATALLARLETGAEPEELGAPTLLPAVLQAEPLSRISRVFGEAFAKAILKAQPGSWFGPVASGYGAHLVIVTHRTSARLATLADVRDAVERDWRSAERQKAQEALYAKLRAKYRITVEGRPYGDEVK